MNRRKGFWGCSFLVWLIFLVPSNLLHAEDDCSYSHSCSISLDSANSGLAVYQNGPGSGIYVQSIYSDFLEYAGAVMSYGNGIAGVYAYSNTNNGVTSSSNFATGIYGITFSESFAGVTGEGPRTGVAGYSEGGYGVWGKSEKEGFAGVQGENSKAGYGVAGIAKTGHGVIGEGGLYGVMGLSHSPLYAGGTFKNDAQGFGVYAETTSPLEARTPTITSWNLGSGYGVHGESKGGTGISGKGLKRGIQGVATTTKTKATGVYGSASGSAGVGVEGSCKKGKGVQGTTETGAGVYGVATETGWAAKFQGYKSASGVLITTNGGTGLVVSGGSKSAVVRTSQGSRLLYAEEATEVYFTDYGSGRLQDGKTVIAVDPLFVETVNLAQPYHVFVQSYSDAQLVVSRRSPNEFEVRLHARDTEGDRNAEFSYRLVAKRKGFEQARLEQSSYADDVEKRMDATALDMSEKQEFLSASDLADAPDVPPPPQPLSQLQQNALSLRSLGAGK